MSYSWNSRRDFIGNKSRQNFSFTLRYTLVPTVSRHMHIAYYSIYIIQCTCTGTVPTYVLQNSGKPFFFIEYNNVYLYNVHCTQYCSLLPLGCRCSSSHLAWRILTPSLVQPGRSTCTDARIPAYQISLYSLERQQYGRIFKLVAYICLTVKVVLSFFYK